MSSSLSHATSPAAASGRPAAPFSELVDPTRFVAEGVLAVVWSVARGLAAIGHAMQQRIERRRAIGELQGLSDHTLKDLGMHRTMIRSVVLEMQRNDPRLR